MSIFSPDYPVSGIFEADPLSSPPLAEDGDERDTLDDFARLVLIARSNDPLFEALRVLSRRLHGARAYLAEAGCNVSLGTAYYRYWRAKHSGVLALLRANRLEARRLLGRLDPGSVEAFPNADGTPATPADRPIPAPDRSASRRRPPRPAPSPAISPLVNGSRPLSR